MSDSPDDSLLREAEAEVEEALHGPERKLEALAIKMASAPTPSPTETTAPAEAPGTTEAPEPSPPPPTETPQAPEQPSAVEASSSAERLLDEYETKPLCPACGQLPPHQFTTEELEAFVRAGALAAPPLEPSPIRVRSIEAADVLQRAFPVPSESTRPPLTPPQAHALLVKLMEKHADEPDVVEALTMAVRHLSVNLYAGFEPVSVPVQSYLIAPGDVGDARARYHEPFRPSWLDAQDPTRWHVESWSVEGQPQPLGFLFIGGCTKTCHVGLDVVLRVKNLGKDTACFAGELAGYTRACWR